jgi:hypothetical protein
VAPPLPGNYFRNSFFWPLKVRERGSLHLAAVWETGTGGTFYRCTCLLGDSLEQTLGFMNVTCVWVLLSTVLKKSSAWMLFAFGALCSPHSSYKLNQLLPHYF